MSASNQKCEQLELRRSTHAAVRGAISSSVCGLLWAKSLPNLKPFHTQPLPPKVQKVEIDTVVLDNDSFGSPPTNNFLSLRGVGHEGARTFSVVMARHFEKDSSSLQYGKEARPSVFATTLARRRTLSLIARFGFLGGVRSRGLYLYQSAEGDYIVGVFQHQIPQTQTRLNLCVCVCVCVFVCVCVGVCV